MGVARRYGIISDIHANMPALQTALDYLDKLGADRILCLGDLVGYGGSPGKVIRTIRARHDIIIISGNHDRQVNGRRDPHMRKVAAKALDWTRRKLHDDEKSYLADLPQGLIVDDTLILVHGSLIERDAYILTSGEVKNNLECLRTEFPYIKLCLFGHTHLPMLISMRAVITDLKRSRSFQLDQNDIYLINPGSVGQPRDRCPMASFALLDLDKYIVSFYRRPYDLRQAQETIIRNKLPERFARRLSMGV